MGSLSASQALRFEAHYGCLKKSQSRKFGDLVIDHSMGNNILILAVFQVVIKLNKR